jgi:hypothetical protein
MKKLSRPGVAIVVFLAAVVTVAVVPGFARADNAPNVPILSGPGNCGNANGGSPIGAVTLTQPKAGALSLGVGITTPYPDLQTIRGGLTVSVSVWDSTNCLPVASLGYMSLNKNGVGNEKFTWQPPCTGGSFFVGIPTPLEDELDSLSFTVPATC